MSVMNIKHLFLAAASLGVFAACSDYDPGLSENVVDYTDEELELIQEYTANFVERYGDIDPNHTWGFGELGSEDEALSTRGSSPEGNLWESLGYEIPAPITDRERAAVVEAFRNHTQSDTNPQLTNFFVQQVYKGGWEYALVDHNEADYTYPDNTEGNPNYYISSEKMNHLHCGVARTGDQLYNEWDNGYDHIFDFNYGNSDDYNGCMLMLNSATTDFYYDNSVDSKQHHEYIILTVTWTEEDGSQHSGAYVGFDFYANGENPNQQCERDWNFDDWIVKIIPGDGNDYDIVTETKQVSRPKTVSARVMCEDLGTTNDFDFNDVVFDVTYTGNGNCTETTVTKKKKGTGEVVSTTTTYSDWTVDANGWTGQITLLASGGTLPIYVQNFNGQQFECHETLLGANNPNLKVGEKYNPINVGANVDGIESVTLSPVSGLTSTNPDNINIYVHAPSSEDRSASAQTTIVLPRAQGGQYEDVSAAPQKICVPSGTKWMKESQQIEWTHTYFRNWVNKENDEYNFGRSMDWTTQGLVKTNLLY